jgi:hypothetical protein
MLHVNASDRNAWSAENREIRCFGFGCPPVFLSTERNAAATLVGQAFDKTVCFINGEDVIPHMSIDAIRRLSEAAGAGEDSVDDETTPRSRGYCAECCSRSETNPKS